ncbi:MAG TPA: OadG family protein [Candidatus Flavonifractor merdigallinarum]|uniref:OadG family protein n=1 Tax=Candidatus Flavonifractor merdigallinarum TaxID=2838589 RepID=A0A9D1YBA4_9FIRM|nr:OadG family protein [Candidatus Flavonifractor merdigallinarum]
MISVTSALLVALSGMVIVFLMLAILCAMIVIISKVVSALTKSAAPAAPAAPAPAVPSAAPAPAAAPGPYGGEVALLGVDEKTAACVMAIVSHETGIPLSELVFKSIKAL